jgi:hypothetical protein
VIGDGQISSSSLRMAATATRGCAALTAASSPVKSARSASTNSSLTDVGLSRGATGDAECRGAQVARTELERGVDGSRYRPCGASGPQQHRHHDGHRRPRPRRDVFDAHQAELPTHRSDQVEDDQHGHRERRLTGGERGHPRNVGCREDRDRKQRPEHCRFDTGNGDQRGAQGDPDGGTGNGTNNFRTGGTAISDAL